MILKEFRSKRPISPFAPNWFFHVGEKDFTDIDCDKLKDYLLSKLDEVLSIEDDSINDHAYGTQIGKDTTTARSGLYNIFSWDHPEIDKLKDNITEFHHEYYKQSLEKNDLPPELWVNGWMNVMKKGQVIRKHAHGYLEWTYLSGHFTVQSSDTQTVYVNPYEHMTDSRMTKDLKSGVLDRYSHRLYAADNIAGRMALFPSFVPHFTTTHDGDDYRITLAFDMSYYQKHPIYIPLYK